MKIFVIILVLLLIFGPVIFFGIYRIKKNKETENILTEFMRLRNEEENILDEMNMLKKENDFDPVINYQEKMDKLEQRRKEIKLKQEQISKMVGEKDV